MDNLFIKIKSIRNNTFVCVSDEKGSLLSYKSLKDKKTKDIKSKLTSSLMGILKKIHILKKKAKYINLTVVNIDTDLILHIYNLLNTWNLNVYNIQYKLPIPHNGCRRTHESRKRAKGKKKNKEYFLGL